MCVCGGGGGWERGSGGAATARGLAWLQGSMAAAFVYWVGVGQALGPVYAAAAEADAAVRQLLGADVVLTTYDALQQGGLGLPHPWCLVFGVVCGGAGALHAAAVEGLQLCPSCWGLTWILLRMMGCNMCMGVTSWWCVCVVVVVVGGGGGVDVAGRGGGAAACPLACNRCFVCTDCMCVGRGGGAWVSV